MNSVAFLIVAAAGNESGMVFSSATALPRYSLIFDWTETAFGILSFKKSKNLKLLLTLAAYISATD